MVKKMKMKLYTTYGKLYYKGKPEGGKYPVKIKATSRASAIKKAKTYPSYWSRDAKKRRDDKYYSG